MPEPATRSRHKDLTGAGLRGDARADVDGDTRDVVASELHLPRVEPSTDLDPDRSERLVDR